MYGVDILFLKFFSVLNSTQEKTMSKPSSATTFDNIWGYPRRTMTAESDLERVLVDNARIPLAFWRKNFFFKGGRNQTLHTLTQGTFPAKADPRGTHPVFALKPIAGGIGFRVCPCSSSGGSNRWVNKNTRLLHTGFAMDKTSYIIDRIPFTVPASQAETLAFKGEVSASDIQTRQQAGAL